MCSATVGDSAVNVFTCAASAIFSCGVRGVPGVPNTLNRVPELPNAHDGNSIVCSPSRGAISEKSVMGLQAFLDEGAGLVVEREVHHVLWMDANWVSSWKMSGSV